MRTLDEYQAHLEALETDLNRETYRQYAGLSYDEAHMERLSAEIERLAAAALAAVPTPQFPRPLLYATLYGSRASAFTRLDNEIYRLRGEGVRAEEGGEVVSLNNWRLFNRRHAREGARRRRVFETLLDRAQVLTPLLGQRFALSREVAGGAGVTPLDIYLEEEGITADALAGLLERTARVAQPPFREALARFADELLGRPAEFIDDYYVFGSVIYEPVDRHFTALDFPALLHPLYQSLGFDLSSIVVDGEPRPGKHASPVCFGVRIPGEVYVLFQRTSPVTDYTGYGHEMGHALHFAAVSSGRSYVDRRLIPAGVAEIFSTLFEALATHPRFLTEEAGIPPDAAADLVRRERFMELYFLTFYAANSLFKLRYWTEHLDMAAADELYGALYQRYVDLAMPGRYWQTHHVLALSDVYAPSYLLAKVRAAELWRVLEERFTERWWRDPRAGAFLRETLMAPGRAVDLGAFSRLDPGPYLASLGLSPA